LEGFEFNGFPYSSTGFNLCPCLGGIDFISSRFFIFLKEKSRGGASYDTYYFSFD